MEARTIDLSSLSSEQKRELLKQLLREKVQTPTTFPLSYGQQGLWFLYQLAPESAAYNFKLAARLVGPLQVQAMRRTCESLLLRHPTLRTSYASTPSGATQVVQEHVALDLQVIDASYWSDAELAEQIDRASDRPFDLERSPPVRISLYRVSPNEHVLLLMTHHIAVDFWSFRILVDDLFALYLSEVTGSRASLPPPDHSYADFVQWQRSMLSGPEGSRLAEYWREKLSGELPVLNLPTDRPRPAVQSFRGAIFTSPWPDDLTQKLRDFATSAGTSLYTLCIAAFQVLLHRYTGQDEILVGSPMAGRSRAEFQDVIGFFVNTVVLRGSVAGDPTFRSFLDQTRKIVGEAIEHQDYPFSLLVQQLGTGRDASRSPMLQTMLVWEKMHRRVEQKLHMSGGNGAASVGGVRPTSITVEQRGAPLDIVLQVFEEHGGPVRICYQYNVDLFDQSTIQRLADHFLRLLESIAADPAQNVSRLPWVSAKEEQLLLAWNNTATEQTSAQTVLEFFARHVREKPNTTALKWEQIELSYAELDRRSSQLARFLLDQGVRTGTRVALCLENSIEMVVAILGVMKAGAAYVPLDASHGPDRLTFLVEDSDPALLITESAVSEKFATANLQTVRTDLDKELIAQYSDDPWELEVDTSAPAYVMYTSGSTGRPNGVVISHANLVHSTAARIGQYPEAGNFLLVSPWSFDSSVAGLFGTLSQGGTLVLAPRLWQQRLDQLPAIICDNQINRLLCIPWLWDSILRTNETEKLRSLTEVIVAGESCPPDLVQRHFGSLPATSLFNEYGPTEATVWSTVCQLKPDFEGSVVPIGKPVANVKVCVLDRFGQSVPIGVPGELYVAGPGVSGGYWNRPELTKERFVSCPTFPNLVLYKTGDIARFRPDGCLEFLGRADGQVKISGCRIELGEVEAAILKCNGIKQAVVIAAKDTTKENRLIAYVVLDGELQITIPELRTELSRYLPRPMIPATFVKLPAMPTNAHGKIDRRALPTPTRARAECGADYVAPRNALEQAVAKIWSDVLEIDKVGIHDDFFALGGASNQVLQVVSRAKSQGIDLTPEMIFRFPTVAEVADALNELQPPSGNTKIESLGVYLPPKSVSTKDVLNGCRTKVNFDLERLTGIRTRRMAGDGLYSIDLAERAVRECFARSQYEPDDVDLIICCNISRFDKGPVGFVFEPSTAIRLAAKFEMKRAWAFDVNNACAGMFTGIHLANLFMKRGIIDRALIVSGEYITHLTLTAQEQISSDLDPRMPSLTLGDAGAAVLLDRTSDTKLGFHDIDMYTLGQHAHLCVAKLSDRRRTGPTMITDVLGVSSVTTREAAAHWPQTVLRHGWGPQDVQHVIPHQVSDTSLSNGLYDARQLGIVDGINVVSNVAERGNTATTSHFVALWDHVHNGSIRSRDNVLFGISGSGMTIGAALYSLDDLPERLKGTPAPKTRAGNPSGFRVGNRRRVRSARVPIQGLGIVRTSAGAPANCVELASTAAKECLSSSQRTIADVGLLIHCGVYRNEFLSEPAVASMVAGSIGLNQETSAHSRRALAFDLLNGSAGFLNACHAANESIRSGAIQSALVVASEVENNVNFPSPRLYGLAEMGSAVLLASNGNDRVGFSPFVFHNNIQQVEALSTYTIDDEKHGYLQIERSNDVEHHYLQVIQAAVAELLDLERVAMREIKAVLGPQISSGFLNQMGIHLGIAAERVIDVTYGQNVYTSSLPLAFQHCRNQKLLHPGDVALVIGVSSGIQAAAALYYS